MKKSFIVLLSVWGVSLAIAKPSTPTTSQDLADEYDITPYTQQESSIAEHNPITVSGAHKEWRAEDKLIPEPIPSDAVKDLPNKEKPPVTEESHVADKASGEHTSIAVKPPEGAAKPENSSSVTFQTSIAARSLLGPLGPLSSVYEVLSTSFNVGACMPGEPFCEPQKPRSVAALFSLSRTMAPESDTEEEEDLE